MQVLSKEIINKITINLKETIYKPKTSFTKNPNQNQFATECLNKCLNECNSKKKPPKKKTSKKKIQKQKLSTKKNETINWLW